MNSCKSQQPKQAPPGNNTAGRCLFFNYVTESVFAGKSFPGQKNPAGDKAYTTQRGDGSQDTDSSDT
ncbi:hypothetical protein D3C74_373230 [compost metagenome]